MSYCELQQTRDSWLQTGLSLVAFALALVMPVHILPQFGTAWVVFWHARRCGGGLTLWGWRVPMQMCFPVIACLRAPLATLCPALVIVQQGIANLYWRWTSRVPRIREVHTQHNGNLSALSNSLVIVSSCVAGGRFDHDVIKASMQNKRRYCALSSSARQMEVRCSLYDEPTQGTHHAKWEKYIHLRQEMAASSHRWFMWIDCDAVFTNASFAWDDILFGAEHGVNHSGSQLHKQDMILARDRNGFNLGVFFLQNTPWSLGFLDAMLAIQPRIDYAISLLPPRIAKLRLRDQIALDELLNADWSLIQRMRVVPQKLINSFFFHNESKGALWEQGDWIAHQVDCRHPDCNRQLETLADAL